MNGTATFRSHLMQHFVAVARTQSRPPIALFSFEGNGCDERPSARRYEICQHTKPTGPMSHQLSSVSGGPCSVYDNNGRSRFSTSQAHSSAEAHEERTTATYTPSQTADDLQRLIASRRTVSNFIQSPRSYHDTNDSSLEISREFLRSAIKRGVECASTAPNHKMTEPATFYRILAPSAASERLLDIVYEVTLRRLLKQRLSGEEACHSEALRKKEKWANIPAFLVVTVGGMNDQTPSLPAPEDENDYFSELPYVAPSDTRQLEDYASTCASIQNLLLSLHSEGLVSKWATGPIIRTLAFRELIGCKLSDMVVGLIFVGWSRREPRMPRRRRSLDGDVLRDL
ncbi:hypothetical protein HJC23_010143 [Cyclotella cryptica]|uniref:Nitroreductase domain-containing protein n=1 Tax=Cyclotella cryptica TaxID=29204 RepID=A0ABD3NQH0_9STRA|eukprot:CCRYP_020294-RA/>CCRYP_020294-RA protein AED:0.11 eAED:0.11 QI:0/-1/0/1/-1/1/1/0/341